MSSSKPTFFARYALLILIIVFFFIPFAFRGSRFAVMRMKNDVKDWLPSTYTETSELDWFRKHFLGEQFVILTWDGCKGDDQDERYKLFVAKLSAEEPPSERLARESAAKAALDATLGPAGIAAEVDPDAARVLDENGVTSPAAETVAATESVKESPAEQEPVPASPTKLLSRDNFIGDKYGLHTTGNDYQNWGKRDERWIKGAIFHEDSAGKTQVAEERWFFITPEGDLYLWNAVDAPVAALWRNFKHHYTDEKADGTLVHSFGPIDGPWYYENPKRLRAQLFKSITTGPDVLASLTREGGVLHDDPEEAKRRLTGVMFGPQGQTSILITLTDSARRDLHQLVGRGLLGKPRGRLYEIAEECSISPDCLRMGGPPIDNVAIDEEGSITLLRLIGLCAILGLGLSFACFRSVSATIMVFFVGGISAVLSLAFVYWLGSSVDAITMSMPALVYVLGLSGAVHIINYYHEAVTEHGHVGAPETAVRHGWKPAIFCNLTTAIGLVSLYTSEIVPIRKFGLFAALGVMATLVLLFTYLPAVLQIWPQKRRLPAAENEGEWLDRYLSGFWQWLGGFCIRHNVLVATGCVVLIAGLGWGTVYIKTSVNLLKMFNSEAKIIKDYVWLEENLGRLVPMEIVLSVDKKSQLPPAKDRADQSHPEPEEQFQLSFLERMELAAHVQQVLEEEFGSEGQDKVGRAMSAATFAPKLPKAKGDTSTFARRGATSRLLESHRDDFLRSDYLRVDQQTDAELWRISLRLPATRGFKNRDEASIDYGDFVKDLKRAVEPIMSAQQCRENVLRGLVQGRAGARPSGAGVLLLGVPAESLGKPESAEKKSAVDIDQTKIFSRALIDSLNIARLRVRSHVPESSPLSPEQLQELAASHDCVILVSNRSGYNLDALKGSAKIWVDARDHIFDPGLPNVATSRERKEKLTAVYTGIVPIVYKAQRALLDSLIASTFWSFITITPLMMFIARSFWAGSVAMLPNVLPVLVIFGCMGWLGIDVDVGSMMTASIALGVAVDDTIHYLNWFREELDRVGDRHQAILGAYKHCATPTFQSAVISGLGLSIFAISTFTPTQRFGYLMLAILWAGVAAELIFFPALLAGPLGLVFVPRKKKVANPSPSDAAVSPPSESDVLSAADSVAAESSAVVAEEPATTDLPPAPSPVKRPTPAFALTASALPAPIPAPPPPPELPPPPTESAIPAPHGGRSKSAVLKILRQDRSH